MASEKLTRGELLAVVAHLQDVVSVMGNVAANDRNPHRASHMEILAKHGLDVCIEARAGDPPGAGSRTSWGKTLKMPELKP